MKMLLKPTPLRNWKKSVLFSISFIVCFFAEIAINIACGPENDPYDYYISFFHNNIHPTNEYRPFYFTSYTFLYDYEEQVSEAAINSNEWAAFLGEGVRGKDVEKVMYKLGGHTDTVLYNGYLAAKAPLPDSLKSNTFLQALSKNKSALQYYRFAKSVEPLAVRYDSWDPKPIDTGALKLNGEQALKTALTEKNEFIKLRYLYQAQRLLHYAGEYKQAVNVYDKYIINSKEKSSAKGWSLALKAGEERRLGDTVKAAYLFSKVFAQSPERRVQAFLNYNFMIGHEGKVLAMAKNDTEKATIYAIEGFHNPKLDIKPLQQIYECQPTSQFIDVLLAREINKLEEVYLTKQLTDAKSPIVSSFYGNPSDTADNVALAHIKALNKFCERLAAERKYPQYGLGNIASAYLAWMQKDTKAGFNYLAALKSVSLSKKLDDQQQIVNLLLTAQSIQQNTIVNEAQLLPSLKWLDNRVKEENKPGDGNDPWNYYGMHPFAATTRNFYHAILAPAYLKQGDTSRAAAAMLKGDVVGINESSDSYPTSNFWQNYLGSVAVNKLIDWRNNRPQNAWLQFLTNKLVSYNKDDLYDLLGTTYLREHNYSKAAAALKLVSLKKLNDVPENFYDETASQTADVFISRLADYPKITRYKKSRGYNKLEFAQAMALLQKQMKTAPADPAAYFKYATGLYNTGSHGNAWYLISYSWSASDVGRKSQYYYDGDYVRSTNAETYFLKARQISTNPEFKAKCTFMAAKCQQKQVLQPDYDYANYEQYKLNVKQYAINIRRNPYFGELKTGYAKTAFYKQAVNECSYLRDFLKPKSVSKK